MRRAQSEPRVPRRKVNKSPHVSLHTLQPLDLHALAEQLELSDHAADNLLTAVDRWPDTPLSPSSSLTLPQISPSSHPSRDIPRQPQNQSLKSASSPNPQSQHVHQQRQHHQERCPRQSTQSHPQVNPTSHSCARSPLQSITPSVSESVFPTVTSGPTPSSSSLPSSQRPPRAYTSPVVPHRSPSSTTPLKLWSSLRRLWDAFVPPGSSAVRDTPQLPAPPSSPSLTPTSPPIASTDSSNHQPAVTAPQHCSRPADIDTTAQEQSNQLPLLNSSASGQSQRQTDDIFPSPVTPTLSVPPSAGSNALFPTVALPSSPQSQNSVSATSSLLSGGGCSENSRHERDMTKNDVKSEVHSKKNTDMEVIISEDKKSDDCLNTHLDTSSGSDDSTELSIDGSTVYDDVKEELSNHVKPSQATVSSRVKSSDSTRKTFLSTSLSSSPPLPSSYLPPSRQISSPLSSLPQRRSTPVVPASNQELSSPSSTTVASPPPPPDRSCTPLAQVQQQPILHLPPAREAGSASNRLFAGRTHPRVVTDLFEHDLSEADLSPDARPSDDDLSYLRSISTPPPYLERGRRNSAPALSNNKTLPLRRRFSFIPPSPILTPPPTSPKQFITQPSPLYPSPMYQPPAPSDSPVFSTLPTASGASTSVASTVPPVSASQHRSTSLPQQTQQFNSTYQQTQPTQLSWDVPPPGIRQSLIPSCGGNQPLRFNPPLQQAPTPTYYHSARGQQPQLATSSRSLRTPQPAVHGPSHRLSQPNFPTNCSQTLSQNNTSTVGGLQWQSPVQYDSYSQQNSNERLRQISPQPNDSIPQPVELRLPTHLRASHHSTIYQSSHSTLSNGPDQSMARLTRQPQAPPRRSLSLRPNMFSNHSQVSYPNTSYTVSPPAQDGSFRRRASLRTPPPRASTVSGGLDGLSLRRASVDPTLDRRIAQLRSLQQQLRSQRRMTEAGSASTNGFDYRERMINAVSDRRSHTGRESSHIDSTIRAAKAGHVPRNVRLPMHTNNVSAPPHRPMRDKILSVESSLYT